MSDIIVFLGVLIFSLFVGNGLLFLFPVKKQRHAQVIESVEDPVSEEIATKSSNFNPSVAPLNQKIELAHKRIQLLEGALESSTSHGISPSMKRRIEKLDNFRSTVEAEMIGMKEILTELQNNNITVKARVYKQKKQSKKISNEELKRLIYNSSA